MSETTQQPWDAGVEWEPIAEWDIPLVEGRLAPTAKQRLRLGEGAAPTVIGGRSNVVGIRPAGCGSWLMQGVDGTAVEALLHEDPADPKADTDPWEVRFGTAPLHWLANLSEFDGW